MFIKLYIELYRPPVITNSKIGIKLDSKNWILKLEEWKLTVEYNVLSIFIYFTDHDKVIIT